MHMLDLNKKRANGSDFKIKLICPKQESSDDKCILYNSIPYGLYPNNCFDLEKTIVPFYKEDAYSVLVDIDEVTPEKKIDNLYIPDVALLQNNKLLRAVEIVYTYLFNKFASFRILIDRINYYLINAAKYYSYIQRQKDTEKFAFDLLIDWATKKHYSPKSLLLVLSDREFYQFLEDHSYLEMDRDLRLQSQKWFEHFNKSKWYHYLSSEDEILKFYGQKGLKEHRNTLANLNSIATWSLDYTT
ncbi:MAG: hypothetical protein SCH66_11250 [Methanolobus sp.]|nr:hypothetical protein [Methanolobus sp.]